MSEECETPEAEKPVEVEAPKAKPVPKIPTREEARADVNNRIVHLTPLVGEAAREHERLKEDTKSAKAVWEGRAAELTDLCMELVEIENGTWQPRLPFPLESGVKTPAPIDPADTIELSVLTEFGLTAKQIEKIHASKLAAENPMKTVGDFIRAIGKSEWWHRDIKGFGETAIEKVTDALTAFRNAHPIPEEDEGEELPEPTAEDVEQASALFQGDSQEGAT